MRFVRPTFAAAACLLAAGAAADKPTDAEISALVARYSGTAIAERQDMHKNPELSNRETIADLAAVPVLTLPPLDLSAPATWPPLALRTLRPL